MKLFFKMPTKLRPRAVTDLIPRYYQLFSGLHEICFVVSCDSTDATMTDPAVCSYLESFRGLSILYDEFRSKVEAYNGHLDACSDWDIMVVTSDDMVPQVSQFDDIIATTMTETYPDTDGALHFNDGYAGSRLNTLPIIGRKYFERFGYVYHPSYKSLWCDDEFTAVARSLDRLRYLDWVIIKHCHPVVTGEPRTLSTRQMTVSMIKITPTFACGENPGTFRDVLTLTSKVENAKHVPQCHKRPLAFRHLVELRPFKRCLSRNGPDSRCAFRIYPNLNATIASCWGDRKTRYNRILWTGE